MSTPTAEHYALASRSASLGVGHIWSATSCPAYRTLDPLECVCQPDTCRNPGDCRTCEAGNDCSLLPRYAVRRFTRSSRPDAFEVYEVATDKCASFPGRKRECQREADRLNEANT